MSRVPRVNAPVLYAAVIVSVVARMYMIARGIYGYTSTYDALIEGAWYREYLAILESLGKLAIIASAIQSFAGLRTRAGDALLLIGLVAVEVAFGCVSGFKSAIGPSFCDCWIGLLCSKKPLCHVVCACNSGSLMLAFLVIEPFRIARNDDANFVGTNIGSIVATMVSAAGDPLLVEDQAWDCECWRAVI